MKQSVFCMDQKKGLCLLFFFLAGTFFLGGSLFANLQDSKTLLFQEATKAMEQAQAVQAELFSPNHFKTAMKYYQKAEEDYDKGRNLEDIQKNIKMAAVYFLKALESANLFQTHLAECIAARNDALAVEAMKFRKKQWEDAELALNQAAKTLEDGNLEGAKSRGEKAEQLYKQVELESIKANYLDETKVLLETNANELKKMVPLTFKTAQDLIINAENLLIKNRYDTDEARQLAQEAKYEAQHALYLAKKIENMKEKTVEELLLESEKPIQKISDEFDLNPRFDQGFDPPTASIIQDIQNLKKEIASLRQDLDDKNGQVSTLSDQLNRAESQLGDLKTKEATLSQIMEQQERSREKFARIEKLFTPEEAQILRMGEDVVIRLYSLTFPVGKATIEPQYYGLLSKVIKATEEYPESKTTVEGHTDSWGSDEANQKLSTQRAEAVREYFLATAGLDSTRIIATGYGESKPIASNETQEGRRKNRRIDIVIHPKK